MAPFTVARFMAYLFLMSFWRCSGHGVGGRAGEGCSSALPLSPGAVGVARQLLGSV